MYCTVFTGTEIIDHTFYQGNGDNEDEYAGGQGEEGEVTESNAGEVAESDGDDYSMVPKFDDDTTVGDIPTIDASKSEVITTLTLARDKAYVLCSG